MKDKWDAAAANPGVAIPVGDEVVCDVCNDDYTASEARGGFLFGSYAYCPKCAVKSMPSIRKYNEEGHIHEYCPLDMSFADWVRDYRKRTGQNYIRITPM